MMAAIRTMLPPTEAPTISPIGCLEDDADVADSDDGSIDVVEGRERSESGSWDRQWQEGGSVTVGGGGGGGWGLIESDERDRKHRRYGRCVQAPPDVNASKF